MKNITKTLLVMISSSLISFASVAGELTVTGSANASYVINGGDKNNSNKGLGISNELMFAASGELDNGFTWNYHTELDMADGGAASNDDTAIVFGLGDMGKLGIYDAEGGLSTELSYGVGALGTGQDFGNTMTSLGGWGYDVSADPHIEYHFPADLLPAGLGVSVGYAPNTADGQGNSYKSAGADTAGGGANGTGAQQIKITAAPVDGLSLAADYYEVTNTKGSTIGQTKSGGNMSFQYAMGNFKVGAMRGYGEPGRLNKAATASADTATASNAEQYITTGMGIEFAINENLSVSYNVETNERNDKTRAATGSTYIDNKIEAEADIFQIAYNIGGATAGIHVVDTDNSDYVVGKEESKTIFSLALAF